MNRICIGITQLTPGWQSLLDQIGVWYELVDFDRSLTAHYSAIIVSEKPSHLQHKKLAAYLHHGGCVLAGKSVKNFLALEKSELVFIAPIADEYHNKVRLYATSDGFLIQLSINPDTLYADNSYARKRFYFEPKMHPDELLSEVDKGALASTIDICLKELHLRRELPYIQKWHSPKKEPVFAFRVDSDYGTKESIQNLYEIAERHHIPMTWFLHVEAHEDWLNVFHHFKGQEIALHGYEHGTSTSYEHVFNNIERGKQLLVDAGFEIQGFCVPYGIWNEALGDVLTQFDFEYSSEFTVGYDTLPFFPVHENELHPCLQIPIHPICTGSLNRKKATIDDMMRYFLGVLDQKVSDFENTVFYHHPLQPGLELWNSVFERVNELGLTKLSFLEYAHFWKSRTEATFEAWFDAKKKELRCNSSNNELFVKISFEQDAFYLLQAKETNAPLKNEDKIHSTPPPTLSAGELDELKSNPLQLLKTSLLDWRNRKRL